MIDSLTEASMSIARPSSASSPTAKVAGLWIIIIDTGDMATVDAAIAITDAAEAATPSMFTVTCPG